MSKINRKGLFLHSDFAFVTWVMKFLKILCKTIFSDGALKVIDIIVANLEKLLTSKHFC